ncbi:unnamed protein product [Closterium sp. Naga37s-1]|nr:unnamed protein product [Closterium sp. Naga37s-1]
MLAVPFAAPVWLTLLTSFLVFSHARDLSNRRLPSNRNYRNVVVTALNFSSVPSSSSREHAGFDGARGNLVNHIPHGGSLATAAAAEVGKPAQFSTRSAISAYDGPRLTGEAAIPEWLDRDALHELEERLGSLLGEPLGNDEGDHANQADRDADNGAYEVGDWDSPAHWSDKGETGSGGSRVVKEENELGDCEQGVGVRTTAKSDPTVRRRSLRKKPIVPDLIVAQDGSGNVTNLQDAVEIINSEESKAWYIVLLKPGRYVGNVEVERENVVLLGSGAWRTVITGNRSNGAGFDTWDTPSFAVAGNNFVTMGIRFENTAPHDMEAGVAFRADGDKIIAYRCVFAGFQDTVNSHRGRHYFRSCAIFGHVDFIYGRHGAAVFDRCRIAPIPRPGKNGAATIATHGGDTASRREGGFVFYRCWITGVTPTVKAYLGRPWRSHARVVYMFSYLSAAIVPEGWAPWPGENFGPRVFLGEYRNTGPGAWTSGRVRWARPGLLNETQVAPFMPEAFIRGSRWVRRTPVEIVYP